jgi:hypothetical protein
LYVPKYKIKEEVMASDLIHELVNKYLENIYIPIIKTKENIIGIINEVIFAPTSEIIDIVAPIIGAAGYMLLCNTYPEFVI